VFLKDFKFLWDFTDFWWDYTDYKRITLRRSPLDRLLDFECRIFNFEFKKCKELIALQGALRADLKMWECGDAGTWKYADVRMK
jgi:hypothetical protein